MLSFVRVMRPFKPTYTMNIRYIRAWVPLVCLYWFCSSICDRLCRCERMTIAFWNSKQMLSGGCFAVSVILLQEKILRNGNTPKLPTAFFTISNISNVIQCIRLLMKTIYLSRILLHSTAQRLRLGCAAYKHQMNVNKGGKRHTWTRSAREVIY